MGKHPSPELWLKMGEAGILASRIGPGPHLEGLKLPGGVKPEEFDYFHELIVHEENARTGYPGFNDGLGAGLVIGMPPVLNFGSYELKAKVSIESYYYFLPMAMADQVVCQMLHINLTLSPIACSILTRSLLLFSRARSASASRSPSPMPAPMSLASAPQPSRPPTASTTLSMVSKSGSPTPPSATTSPLPCRLIRVSLCC